MGILSDPRKKEKYDEGFTYEEIEQTGGGGGGGGMYGMDEEDIMRMFFGGKMHSAFFYPSTLPNASTFSCNNYTNGLTQLHYRHGRRRLRWRTWRWHALQLRIIKPTPSSAISGQLSLET